ncbi:hypothetical protein BBP00_00009925, partial [Phytophthora kernoviae]
AQWVALQNQEQAEEQRQEVQGQEVEMEGVEQGLEKEQEVEDQRQGSEQIEDQQVAQEPEQIEALSDDMLSNRSDHTTDGVKSTTRHDGSYGRQPKG